MASGRPGVIPIKIGQRPDHGFDEPLGLLSDCHRRIEHFLGLLLRIEEHARDRALTAVERDDVQAALTYFSVAAPRHTADEEESLFPRLRESSDTRAVEVVAKVAHLEHEHKVADEHQAAIDALFRQWIDQGRLAAQVSDTLRSHLTALQAIYTTHIGLEDRELFPAAAELLSPAVLAEIGREMAKRRSLREG